MLLPNKSTSMCFAVVEQKVTIFDLKVNKSPDAAKYRGYAVADLQSTSSTVVDIKLLLNSFLQLLAATEKLLQHNVQSVDNFNINEIMSCVYIETGVNL